MTGATFESTKTSLHDLLAQAENGKLQLPDFQRGWVWDDERIKSLLASVSVSFPIGAVMLLETGGEHMRFKPRSLAGTHERLREVAPDRLILDGQQRLTSLYQTLLSRSVVDTRDQKNKPIRRWYYLDMKEALDGDDDRESVVVSVPEARLVKTAFGRETTLDVSTPECEYQSDMFPANQVFASQTWRREYAKYWRHDAAKSTLFDRFEAEVIDRFKAYQLPVIELKKQTPKEAVCLVFERVNTGGVPLTVFELLTATFAADSFQLRDDWDARESRLKRDYPVLRNLQSDDYLQVISLLVTQERRRKEVAVGVREDLVAGIGCKRRDILKLEVADWKEWADDVEQGFVRAARFLHVQKIFRARDLPYQTQLVPLAAIFVDLGKDGETEGARQRIARWYWCGVLGELYGGAIETRFAKDLPEVVAMVRGATAQPSTIAESSFQPNRLLTLRTRNSSAYKGLYALLMRDGGRDFRSGEPIEAATFFDDKVDIHHVFPEKWCKEAGIDPRSFNSVINKTALSAKTNRQIGGNAPSKYMLAVEKVANVSVARMNEILASHCIDAGHLRADNYWEFFATRAEALLSRIEAATGKTVARAPELFRPGVSDELYEDVDDGDGDEPAEESVS